MIFHKLLNPNTEGHDKLIINKLISLNNYDMDESLLEECDS